MTMGMFHRIVPMGDVLNEIESMLLMMNRNLPDGKTDRNDGIAPFLI